MDTNAFPPLVDLESCGMDPGRSTLIRSIVGPNNEVAARAALQLMEPTEHVHSFGVWTESFARAGHE